MRLKRRLVVTMGVAAVALIGAIVAFWLLGGSGGWWRGAAGKLDDPTSQVAYHLALAGLQEAHATRLVPHTNRLAFSQPDQAYFPSSGKLYGEPATRQRLLGIYRYVVLMPEPGSAPAATDQPQKADAKDDAKQAPAAALVISQGSVCARPGSNRPVPDMLTWDPLHPVPSCKQGLALRRVTLVGELPRLVAPAPTSGQTPSQAANRLQQRIEIKTMVEGNATIRLRQAVRLPDGAERSRFDFESIWQSDQPIHVPTELIFARADTEASHHQAPACAQPPCSHRILEIESHITEPVDPYSTMTLRFGGPVDGRWLLGRAPFAGPTGAASLVWPHLRLWQITGEGPHMEARLVSHVADLVPSLPASNAIGVYTALTPASHYRLEIDAGLPDFFGQTLTFPYTIEFETAPHQRAAGAETPASPAQKTNQMTQATAAAPADTPAKSSP